MKTIGTLHQGIEINYVEADNQWLFTLRGRERKVESLAKAKEIIDKPEPIAKKPFARVKGFTTKGYAGYAGSEYTDAEVTSIAAPGRFYFGGCGEVWVSVGKNREKIDSGKFFPATVHNIKLRRDIETKIAERDELDEEISELQNKLQPIKIEKEQD